MSESIHRFITAGHSVFVDFTKRGCRQFAKVNRSLGRRYIRAFILKRDLAEYIAAHEAAGVHLDTECHELRYDDGICLLLRKEQGQWLITEMFRTEEASDFTPVYIWTQRKRGCSFILTRLLIGWRCLTKSAAERLVSA